MKKVLVLNVFTVFIAVVFLFIITAYLDIQSVAQTKDFTCIFNSKHMETKHCETKIHHDNAKHCETKIHHDNVKHCENGSNRVHHKHHRHHHGCTSHY